MKKLIITIISVLAIILILTIIIVNFSTIKHNKNLSQAQNSFQKKNQNAEIMKVESYYGEDTYYIINYKANKIEYIGVLNNKNDIILTIEKSKLYNLKENKVIGYKNNKLIYEVKKSTKDGFTYSYYNALTGEFIKNIKLNK